MGRSYRLEVAGREYHTVRGHVVLVYHPGMGSVVLVGVDVATGLGYRLRPLALVALIAAALSSEARKFMMFSDCM